VVGVALNPVLLIHPRKYLAKEGLTITASNTKLSDPDRALAAGIVNILEVLLEVLSVARNVVPVGDDEVDLAIRACAKELSKVGNAHRRAVVGFDAVGHRRSAKLDVLVLIFILERVDILPVGGGSRARVLNASTSTTEKELARMSRRKTRTNNTYPHWSGSLKPRR
jgi:hypothetical protein